MGELGLSSADWSPGGTSAGSSYFDSGGGSSDWSDSSTDLSLGYQPGVFDSPGTGDGGSASAPAESSSPSYEAPSQAPRTNGGGGQSPNVAAGLGGAGAFMQMFGGAAGGSAPPQTDAVDIIAMMGVQSLLKIIAALFNGNSEPKSTRPEPKQQTVENIRDIEDGRSQERQA